MQILRIIIGKWKNPPSDEILIKLSEETVGYTGADLNSLCSESVLQSLNRTYPQIYKTSKRLLLDLKKIQVYFYTHIIIIHNNNICFLTFKKITYIIL